MCCAAFKPQTKRSDRYSEFCFKKKKKKPPSAKFDRSFCLLQLQAVAAVTGSGADDAFGDVGDDDNNVEPGAARAGYALMHCFCDMIWTK